MSLLASQGSNGIVDSHGRNASNGVGWFGKVPSVGDFVRRDLPDAFVATWDDWLQRAMICGRRAQPELFDEALRAFPTWRFYIAPGVIDDCAWSGVMQASADRVGRTFPFTLAQALRLPEGHWCDTTWLDGQLDVFARTAINALDQSSLERFERLAGELPDATAFEAPQDPDLEGLNRLTRSSPMPLNLSLSQWLRRLAERDFTRLVAGRCLWWIPPALAGEPGAALVADFPLADELLLDLLNAT